MKTLPSLLALLAIFTSVSFGDGGIPVDRKTGQVTARHELLTVSESQAEEIESIGTLTLSSEQWQQLRAISPSCPKRIEEILPVTYHDCGCALIGVFYGIQLTPNQIAVTHGEIKGGAEISDLRSALSRETSLQLRMDRRGQFFYNGALVPFEKLLQWVADFHKPDGHRSLGVVRPVGIKRDSAIAKDRLDTLFKTAKEAGWEEWDLALDEKPPQPE